MRKKIRKYLTLLFLTMMAALFTVPHKVCAEETTVTELKGNSQLIRELSKNWKNVCRTDLYQQFVSGKAGYGTDNGLKEYQTRQSLVFAEQLDEDYGAKKVFYYKETGTYYLQYATFEDTKYAYTKLKKRYGDNCMLDQIVKAKDWQQSGGVSWGAEYTKLDELKREPAVKRLGTTVTVAVVDTGLNASHTLFSGRRISSASRNLVDDNGDISDVTGHGTHVAGIIADCTPAQVELLSVRIFDENGLSSSSLLQAGLMYAVQNGADVINLSLGESDHKAGEDWLSSCISAAWEKGIPIVCAAGNSKKDVSTCYPACDERTFAVSAINAQGEFAKDFTSKEGSNYGSAIDFAAPGTAIDSASAKDDHSLVSKSGTSMASPFVAAAAAYIKLALPNASVTETKNILTTYAVDLGTPGKDVYYGYGVICIEKLQLALQKYARLTLETSSMVFAGKPCCPQVMVNGIPAGQYSVSYADNTCPGTAKAIVQGTGVFTGSVSADFHIILGKPSVKSLDCSQKGLKLQWESLPGAKHYLIYRKNDKESWKNIKTLSSTETSYTDTAVSAGKTYQYKISAVCGSIVSSYSAEKSTMFVNAASLTGISNTEKGITLKWKKVSGCSGYYIYRKAAGQASWQYLKQVTSGSTTSCTDTNTVQGQTYVYQIRAYKKSGNQKYKGAAANTRSLIRIRKKTVPVLKNEKRGTMKVSWKQSSGMDGYQIRWSTQKTMASAKTMTIHGSKRLTATISRLKRKKTYYVQVRSMKKMGNAMVYGPWSDKKSLRLRK